MAQQALGRAQKKATKEGREIVFLDESGFRVLPLVLATWAPRGERPVSRYAPAKKHLSVISAVTASGKVYFGMEERALLSEDVIRFVRRVQRCVGKPLLLIWDGAGIHTSRVVRQALSEGLSPGVWLERLPPYAPDLNPDEGIWSYLKGQLANVCCWNLDDLKSRLRREIKRLRPKKRVVLGCFAGAQLAL